MTDYSPTPGDLDGILDAALTIWGPDPMPLPHISACMTKIAGDVAEMVRSEYETGVPPDREELRREFGNFWTTAIRAAWMLDLGLDECTRSSLAAQSAYVERRGGGQHG